MTASQNAASTNASQKLTKMQLEKIEDALCKLAAIGAPAGEIALTKDALVKAICDLAKHATSTQGDSRPTPRIDPIYTTDDYPREGLTLAIRLMNTGWALSVYAPGYEPVVGPTSGCIEMYGVRKFGSLGLALDAFAAGKAIHRILPALNEAEKAYELESGSRVTS